MSDDLAIDARGLVRRYGAQVAVDGLDLQVPRGAVFGLLGPNGAGKSTTIRMLCALERPDGGTALVAGHDVARERRAVRRRIGIVFQDPTLDLQLTVDESLRFHADLYAVPRSEVRPRIARLLDEVGLGERRRSLVRTLSGGMRRRLELARALLHEPDVLFLDEPTVGLDPPSRAEVWRLVDELRTRVGTTVLLTTHYLAEAETCDTVAIVDHGRAVALDTPAALRAQVGDDRLELELDPGDIARAIARLHSEFDITAHADPDGVVRARLVEAERVLPRLLAELGPVVRAVRVARPTLDDVFAARTGRTLGEAASGPADPGRLAARRARRGR
ncbi:MAG: daunorubicin resistance transporter ATPase subunit [Thermoleophilia bacterium]|nr:daunorubicin resistance transporter ATPase subunit [Thermoleophilia bacterium]